MRHPSHYGGGEGSRPTVGRIPYGMRLADDGRTLEPHGGERQTLARVRGLRMLATTSRPRDGIEWPRFSHAPEWPLSTQSRRAVVAPSGHVMIWRSIRAREGVR
jgi:hypothetical protein